MGYHTCRKTLWVALLALALPGLQAAETGTAIDINPEADAEAADGEMTFFGVKATKERPPTEAELRKRVEERAGDPYRPPRPTNCSFSNDNILLSRPQRALLIDLLRSIASNFPYGEERVPSYQKQMALALAIRLEPDNKEAKLADYQLRRMRDPQPVAGHKARKVVAAKLWNAGFGLHRFSEQEDDRTLAKCLLDLARHFDPDNEGKIKASKEIGHPAAVASRWESVTEVPSWPEPVRPEVVETKTQTSPNAAAPVNEPESFAFQSKSASLHILQAGGKSAEMFVQAVPLSDVNKKQRNAGLQFSLRPEPPHLMLSQLAENSLTAGVKTIDQHFTDWREAGEFLRFALEAPISLEAERSTGLAALLLTRALAGDMKIDANFRLAATLTDDGSLASRADFRSILDTLTVKNGKQIIAVSPSQEVDLLDCALLGNLKPLLASHFVAVKDSHEAIGLANLGSRPASVSSAIEQFARVQNLTKGMLPPFIVKNKHVQDKLRTILMAIPNDLSSSILLRAGEGRLPKTLSLQGSLTQLKMIEQPIRELLVARNKLQPKDSEVKIDRPDYNTASETFRECETTLRNLRPLLHNDAQPYAVQLIDTIDESLLCFRSDSAGSRRKLTAMLLALSSGQMTMAGLPQEEAIE